MRRAQKLVRTSNEKNRSVDGKYFRRAATAFRPSEGDTLLEGMIDQMNKTTAQASAAIDEALAFVEASNKRIAAMERKGDHHHLEGCEDPYQFKIELPAHLGDVIGITETDQCSR